MKYASLKSMLLASCMSLVTGAALAAGSCATAPVTVGFVPKLDTDPYFQVAQTGAEEAATQIGGKAIKEAPSQATAEAQIEFINNMVAQKVGVIAVSANDANAIAPALNAPPSKASRSFPTISMSPRTPVCCF